MFGIIPLQKLTCWWSLSAFNIDTFDVPRQLQSHISFILQMESRDKDAYLDMSRESETAKAQPKSLDTYLHMLLLSMTTTLFLFITKPGRKQNATTHLSLYRDTGPRPLWLTVQQ